MRYAPNYYGRNSTSTTGTVGTPDGGLLSVVRGDTYDGTANPPLTFSVAKDYTAWAGMLTIRHRLSDETLCQADVVVEGPAVLSVTLGSSDTAFTALASADDFGPHPYDIEMTSGTSVQTMRGVILIARDQTL